MSEDVECLEEVGIPGSKDLRDSLTNCTDPLAAIEEFQVISECWLEEQQMCAEGAARERSGRYYAK